SWFASGASDLLCRNPITSGEWDGREGRFREPAARNFVCRMRSCLCEGAQIVRAGVLPAFHAVGDGKGSNLDGRRRKYANIQVWASLKRTTIPGVRSKGKAKTKESLQCAIIVSTMSRAGLPRSKTSW